MIALRLANGGDSRCMHSAADTGGCTRHASFRADLIARPSFTAFVTVCSMQIQAIAFLAGPLLLVETYLRLPRKSRQVGDRATAGR